MYNAVQRKMKSLTVQEPNPYHERKLELHQEYLQQLDKVVKEYPAYKAQMPNDYNTQLSLLNGITKKIGMMQKDIKDKTLRFERSVNMGDVEIQKLKKVESNLQKFTSVEELDLTSKHMLDDMENQYNRQKLYFWIKVGVILLIVIHSVQSQDIQIQTKEVPQIVILLASTVLFSLLYLLYLWWTSRG